MTSRELIRYSLLHERRARAGWWTSSFAVAIVVGAAIAGWVAWRGETSPLAASRAWLVCTVVAYMVAFIRVPFHVYWRADAALLAQLPIGGIPLFDAALLRCARAAASITLAVAIGLVPLHALGGELVARHAAFAGTFALVTAFLIPAVVVWTASWVAHGITGDLIHLAQGGDLADLDRIRMSTSAARSSASAILGAVPGALGSFVIVFLLLVSPWLVGDDPKLPVLPTLGGLAAASLVAIAAVRVLAGKMMGNILRDVSALDRQRLATLEIRPPTGIERLIGKLVGDGALAYDKDARLMRRRYPMAFALGGLAFVVLVGIGFAKPGDPAPWLTVTLAGGTAYAVALAGRLGRPPIELPRLSSTLPIERAAAGRAKLAWLVGWWAIFLAAPGLFASLRQADPVPGLALVVGGTLVTVLAGWLRR